MQRILYSPRLELTMGLLLLLGCLVELAGEEELQQGLGAVHGMAALGLTAVVQSLPGAALGVSYLDEAAGNSRAAWKRGLDGVLRCRLAALTLGGVLLAAAADALGRALQGADSIAALGPDMGVETGLLFMGLAPFVEFAIALCKAADRLDVGQMLLPQAMRIAFLDKAVRNPWVRRVGGAALLLGGALEFALAAADESRFAQSSTASAFMLLFGAYTFVTAAPQFYQGLRWLSGER